MECACPSIRPWWGGARKCGSGILPPDTAECRPEYSGPETAGSSGKQLSAGAVVLRGGAGRRGVRTAAREDFRHVCPARSTKLRTRGIGPGPCGARAYSTRGGRHFGIDRGGRRPSRPLRTYGALPRTSGAKWLHAPPKLAEAHRAVGSGAPAGAASATRHPICTARPGRGTFRADENLSVFHYFISLIYSSICNAEPIHPREPSCLSGTIRLLLPTGTANLRSTTVVSLKKEKTCRKKQPCWP